MNEFWLWFSTGFEHILDWNGYDHILYVMSLCVLFSVKEWRKLLVLITAFTIGHSLTLAFSVLNILTIQQPYIEVLIPLTIMLTCLMNVFYYNRKLLRTNTDTSADITVNLNYNVSYILTLLFGFIHGMGFSYLLKSLLGKEESITYPLLYFNFGLELGQLTIVSIMLLMSVFLIKFTKIKKTTWIFIISSAVFGIALFLFIQRLVNL